MARIAYEPFTYQVPFQNSLKSKVLLSTGWGGGKTYSLIMKMFKLMDQNPGFPGGLLVPTLKMYKRDVLPTIREICRDNGIQPHYNKTDHIWNFKETKSTIYVFHSEDDGNSIKGPNLAWFIVNEITLCSKMAFLAAIGRIRIKDAKVRQIAASGSPEGFNWCYEYFIETPREDTDLIFGDMRDNVHISDSYVGMLQESYDPLMQKQYIEGQYVNLSKKACAYAFDRKKHTAPDIDKVENYPVWVSLDFNVTPMAATLWNRVPFTEKHRKGWIEWRHELRAFDEICLESSNTYELAEVLKSKIELDDEVIVYPDPTGIARSTQSRGLSDIAILRNAGFKNVRYKPRISVRDCLNALNAKLAQDRIIINSKRCRNLIADLEQCVFRGGTFEIDKTNLKRSHWLDGMKNMIDYEFPIGGRRAHRQLRYL